jgi:hypothetical protein
MNLLFVCKNLVPSHRLKFLAKQGAEIGVCNESFALSSPSIPCQTNKLKLLIVRALPSYWRQFLFSSSPNKR